MRLDAFGGDQSLRTGLHNAGATFSFGSPARAFDIGGSFFWRANEGTWGAADFRGVNLLASGRLQPISTVSMTATYALYTRTFPEQPALDHTEHLGSARVAANFPTRTTVVGTFSAGQKRYSDREVLPDVRSTSHGGRGFGRSLLAMSTRTQLAGAPVARTEWTWALRLAQSLEDRTGVWIEREDRRTGGQLSPAIIWTPPLFYDDGVYDDPYVVEAGTWRAGIKHVFSTGQELEGWWSQSARTYTGLARSDELSRAGLQAVLPVLASSAAALDLLMEYSYFHNDSSEILESYRASQASAGVRFRF
jgi:hypothetical protein